jgi:DNA polymerase III delta prime subunit
MPKKLWVEVYRPNTIEDYLFQSEDHKEKFEKFIKDKSIPHLLLKGHRGTGKTTMALILKNELGIKDTDFKVLNASDDNAVDIIRGDVKAFSSTMPVGDFKIVFLDEADYLTHNAQAALRGMMEKYSETVRFILTCNRPHKIINELKSRCQEFTFKEFNKQEMAIHVFHILKEEGVKNINADIIKSCVVDCYPDMRKLLQTLETNVIDGVLHDPVDVGDNEKVFVGIIEQLNNGNWLDVREHIVKSIEDSEWDNIYRFLYDNLEQITGFDNIMNWKQGIVIIADHLRFHHQVADPEINFSACMLRLSDIVGETDRT